jgi:hypothetical protein
MILNNSLIFQSVNEYDDNVNVCAKCKYPSTVLRTTELIGPLNLKAAREYVCQSREICSISGITVK